jgi:spore coat polysaccharide biosynthesis protein SpsF
MTTKLLTILTIRTSSERLPGKALAEIKSKTPGGKKQTLPLAAWIIRRLRQMDTMLCVATTNEDSDNELTKLCQKEGVEVVRGSTDDVISRMQAVIETGQYPGTEFVFRALGDCPFVSTEIVQRSAKALEKTGKEAMVFCLPPDIFSVYGSREMSYNKAAWGRIVQNSPHREHPDMYFHQNREKFQILYHLPPDNIFFRPYRLELDEPNDLSLISAIADEVGMLADLRDVIKFLDGNPDIAKINAHTTEKTGPLSLNTYSNGQRRKWLMNMVGKSVYTWTDEWVNPPDTRATPILCSCGWLVGWGHRASLYMRDGSRMDRGFPRCKSCGLLVREWKEAIQPSVY